LFGHGSGKFICYLLFSHLARNSEVSQPFSILGVLLNKLETLLDYLSGWLFVSGLLLSLWVGLDGFVYLLIEVFTGLYLGLIESFAPL